MKHYSKWDIESWQLTGRRSSYKYISRSKHWRCYRPITIERYLWTRPPSKIGSPLTIYARSIFFFYISSSFFPLLHPFLVSISSSISTIRLCFHGVVDLLPQIQDRWIHARFSTFSELPPPVVKSLYLLSRIEWILVARSKTNVWRECADTSIFCTGSAESADTYFPWIGRLLLFHCGKRQRSEHFQW